MTMMRHHVFEQSEAYPVAILAKNAAFNKTDLLVNYVDPLRSMGVPAGDVVAFNLPYNDANKAPVPFIKEYLNDLMPALQAVGAEVLYVADANYFKVIAGVAKADPHHGYVLPCKLKGHENLKVVLGVNHQALIYNPEIQSKLFLSLKTVADMRKDTYQAPGSGIIHSASFPEGVQQIGEQLQALHLYPELYCDIEAFSLRFWEAGIGTIAFAWDQHHGTAFSCDYQPLPEKTEDGRYGEFVPNPLVRRLLLEFFLSYKGKLVFHKADYDVGVIIYTLWMADLLDQRGLLTGLDVMTRSIDDTKIITYLAVNSTAGNELSLKVQAQEFAGNWAVEVKDIRRVSLTDLLQYNLVDALSTCFVKAKHYPTMVQDCQLELYEKLMLPSLKLIIQLELTGMPMNDERLQEVKAKLEQILQAQLDVINTHPLAQEMNRRMQVKAMTDANEKLKVKQHPIERFSDPASKHYVCFNPGSALQLQELLYKLMKLPVIDLTDTKQPATGGETLEKLINHCQDQSGKDLLTALMVRAKIVKILDTFIPAFEAGVMKADGMRYLHGSFNIGGTVSGRLSSSDPNLQNLPANVVVVVDGVEIHLGKLIKSIFMGPAGWLFCGADFNSLEDYISALTTKDPNKLNVYIRGFDGHCLRACYYFRDELPDVDLDDPDSVNQLKKKDHPKKHLRQDSKAPTFALTYQGTAHTLMTNLGWSEEKAKAVEANYHELYKVSDQYIQSRLKQASIDGYVEVAFGLRLRTPLLAQVMFGGSKMPYQAAAEGRTAGNAMGQSYGLLNNRAAVAFWEAVWASEYRYDILPIALIHDAIYPLIRDNPEVMEFANRELIKAMRWQELPEIQHDTVKLGAALDVFWPSWANGITLPNDAGVEQIIEVCTEAKQEYLKKAA